MKRIVRTAAVLTAFLVALPAAAANYLWEVSSATNKVYLFGTVHAGKASWYPLPKPVQDAFESSPVLAVEADITNPDAMAKSARAAIYTPPANLGTHVPGQDYLHFLHYLPRYGLSEEELVKMKPFMASSVLVFSEWARLGYSPTDGVDVYLLRQAKEQQKKIVELEGVDTQIALMDSLTDAENLAIFRGTLEALDSGLTGEQVAGMVSAWQKGDPNAMLEVARKYNEKIPVAADVEERFIWSRHDAMMAKIQDWLDHGRETCFVAVGALHLAGPRGLVERLRARGYKVKQL